MSQSSVSENTATPKSAHTRLGPTRIPGAIVRYHEVQGRQVASEYCSVQRLAQLDLQHFTYKGDKEIVVEVQHPVLKQFYVMPPLAGFWSSILEPLQNSVQCDWTQVYTLVVERLRAKLFDVRTSVSRGRQEDAGAIRHNPS